MSDKQSWVIQTEDLQIGTVLSFDLTDATGQVLHKAGLPINDRLKERLKKRNIHSVTIRGAANCDEVQTESLLIDSYSPGSVIAIRASIESTQFTLRKLIATVQNSEEGDIDELREHVKQFVEEASRDVAAALAVIALGSQDANSEIVDLVAKRSAKLSLLGVITSVVKADEPNESVEIGLAGLLHDCSLLINTHWFSMDTGQRKDRFLAKYQRHPIESAELVNATKGISKNVVTMITQVHEQADGTGYPRGMKLTNTLPGASILNLADAYLALVEPIQGNKFVPSDALAYLCYHTSQGKFCKFTLQLMIQGMSIYPVGSPVLLDDESTALVIQGNPGKPLQPVIRLQQLENLRIDLRDSSRTIVGPFIGSDKSKLERIKKSQMLDFLWRTDR